jgi:hypothetical protein
VSTTATASAPAVEINMATFTSAERARCMFCFKETKFKGNFAPNIARNLAVGLQFTLGQEFRETGCYVRHAKSPGRPCVCDATVEQLRESFVRVHENQSDVRLGKRLFQMLLRCNVKL